MGDEVERRQGVGGRGMAASVNECGACGRGRDRRVWRRQRSPGPGCRNGQGPVGRLARANRGTKAALHKPRVMRRSRGGATAGCGGREGRSGLTGAGAGGPAEPPADPARTPRLRVRPGERTHNGEPYVVPTQCAAARCDGHGHAHAPRTRERFGGLPENRIPTPDRVNVLRKTSAAPPHPFGGHASGEQANRRRQVAPIPPTKAAFRSVASEAARKVRPSWQTLSEMHHQGYGSSTLG